ncbi:MAG: hypothetical protein LQ340_000402 [Diploschistes diacapsis]|nr:MAG: hypothetical protein LQ340_000402 [Diploschistes diacapsis]
MHGLFLTPALREKDKEIARLRLEIASLGAHSSGQKRPEALGDPHRRRKSVSETKSPKGQGVVKNKRLAEDGIAVKNVSNKAVDEGPAGLTQMLPDTREVFASYRLFCSYSQACSFPILIAEYSDLNLDHFLMDIEQSAVRHMDALAFLFAILAQSTQHDLYDRSNEQWIAEVVEDNAKEGKVYPENLRARLCGNQVEPKSMDTQGPNGDSVSSYRTAGLRSSTTYSDLESKGIANNVKSNRTASRKGHAKDEPTNSTPIKKARLSALSSANKGTKGSALRKCRNKQSLSPATGVPASSSSALEARNRVGPSPLYANNECKRPSTAGDDLTAQLSIKSPNTASLLSPVTTDLSYPYRPLTSASVSAADACVLDQFYLDRQISLASTSTVDMQPFNALASPTTRPCPINYPSQPPSLSSHSYPPSIYTNSIPSSLHTPSASHPVSPMLGQGTLAMVTDGQPSFCGGQPITQPQTPSWPFDADHGIENTDCLMTDLNAFGQQDDVRWVWPNAGSW